MNASCLFQAAGCLVLLFLHFASAGHFFQTFADNSTSCFWTKSISNGRTHYMFLRQTRRAGETSLVLFDSIWSKENTLVDCVTSNNQVATKSYVSKCWESEGRPFSKTPDVRFNISELVEPAGPCTSVGHLARLRASVRRSRDLESVDQQSGGESSGLKLRRSKRAWIIPGTLWCGAGHSALNFSDLGMYEKTDMCCREHDHCKDSISSFGFNYGVFNTNIFTLSHCDCDEKFRRCLHKANDSMSNVVGYGYFNILKMRCFEFSQRMECAERTWWGMCKFHQLAKYALVKDATYYNSTSPEFEEDTQSLSTLFAASTAEPTVTTGSASTLPELHGETTDSPQTIATDSPQTDSRLTETNLPQTTVSHQNKTTDSPEAKTTNSPQTEMTDSPLTKPADSTQTKPTDSTQPKTTDSPQTNTTDSTDLKPTDSSQTKTADSKPTDSTQPKSTDSPQTKTTASKPTDSTQPKATDSKPTDSPQTKPTDSTQTKTTDSPQTNTTESTQPTATDSPQTKTTASNPTDSTQPKSTDSTQPKATDSKPTDSTQPKSTDSTQTKRTDSTQTNTTDSTQTSSSPKTHLQPHLHTREKGKVLTCESYKDLDSCRHQIPGMQEKFGLRNAEFATLYHCNCTARLAKEFTRLDKLDDVHFFLLDFVSQFCFILPLNCTESESCSGSFTETPLIKRWTKDVAGGRPLVASKHKAKRFNSKRSKRKDSFRLYKKCLRMHSKLQKPKAPREKLQDPGAAASQ